MNLVFLAASLTLTTAVYAQSKDYRLTSVPHSEIDHHLRIGSDASKTPPSLQGLWWMDGNPLPDKIVSFAGVQFTELVNEGQVVGYECYLPVYDQGIWSWDDTEQGRDLYGAVLQTRLTYHAKFNKEFTRGEVTPIVQLLPPLPPLELPQSLLLDFSMNRLTDEEYSRDSIIFGEFSTYRFRRVVGGDGRRLPAYAEYLQSIASRGLVNALLPVCDANTNGLLPTVCSGFAQ